MKVLDNGDYVLEDGKVISKDDIVKLHEKTPKGSKETETKDDLSEGQSSGRIRLED